MFDWDEANEEHVLAHGITPTEVEEALEDPNRVRVASYNTPGERRTAYVGATAAGRLLYVVVTPRETRTRIVTAYDTDKTEQRRYRKRGK